MNVVPILSTFFSLEKYLEEVYVTFYISYLQFVTKNWTVLNEEN